MTSERVSSGVKGIVTMLGAGYLQRVRLDAEDAALEVRLKSLQMELVAKQVEKALSVRTTKSREGELSQGRIRVEELRGADAAIPKRK